MDNSVKVYIGKVNKDKSDGFLARSFSNGSPRVF